MTRGPAPKLTKEKLLAGNPGGRPLNFDEPKFPDGEMPAPEFLDDSGKRLWQEIVPPLKLLGLAKPANREVLGRYCEMLVRYRELLVFIRKSGTTYPVRAPAGVPDAKGKTRVGPIIGFKEWPQYKQVRELEKNLLIYEREFGITPAAATRVKIKQEVVSGGSTKDLKAQYFGGIAPGNPIPIRAS